jgi:mitochondrial import inner membrane translocase subunit TIM22
VLLVSATILTNMSTEQNPSEVAKEVYGGYSKSMYLPFFRQIRLPAPPDEVPILPSIVNESCGSKIITGAIMGSVLGVGMGLFMGAMGDVSPIQVINGREVPQAPLREQVRSGFKSIMFKSRGWAKSFGILTALFGGIECLIEKYRAKHDVWNPVVSGCVVGATLSAKGGPAAACVGCAGFAGFSIIVDKIMGH